MPVCQSFLCRAAALTPLFPFTQTLGQEEPVFKVKLKVSLGNLVRLVSGLKERKGRENRRKKEVGRGKKGKRGKVNRREEGTK